MSPRDSVKMGVAVTAPDEKRARFPFFRRKYKERVNDDGSDDATEIEIAWSQNTATVSFAELFRQVQVHHLLATYALISFV